jgi:Ran GTPase-activating protein (RanGAP) involved in mRNA processing and transport
LAELLGSPNASCLQELFLDNDKYQCRRRDRPKLDIHMIAAALRHNNKLCVLDLSDNSIDDDDLDVLARCMVKRDDDNDHDDGGLPHNSSLQTLILARNCITNAGLSRLLYQWLPRIRFLKTLALWGNLAEDTGTTYGHAERKRQRQPQQQNHSILRNQAIKAMLDLEDVELIKAVALPEQVPVGLWPLLLARLWEVQKSSTKSHPHDPHDLVHLMVRGVAHLFGAKR